MQIFRFVKFTIYHFWTGCEWKFTWQRLPLRAATWFQRWRLMRETTRPMLMEVFRPLDLSSTTVTTWPKTKAPLFQQTSKCYWLRTTLLVSPPPWCLLSKPTTCLPSPSPLPSKRRQRQPCMMSWPRKTIPRPKTTKNGWSSSPRTLTLYLMHKTFCSSFCLYSSHCFSHWRSVWTKPSLTPVGAKKTSLLIKVKRDDNRA